MTNLLIPMAGAGSRFSHAGYTQPKPLIPVTDRHTGKNVPMVVAAVTDLLRSVREKVSNIIFIIQKAHLETGVDRQIGKYYPEAKFITVDYLTGGQAETCLLAKSLVNNSEHLLIGACDNGMDINVERFHQLQQTADAVIFTFRHNPAVLAGPEAYGWLRTAGDTVTGVSIKKPVSQQPMKDHAIVGTFWFRSGSEFVEAAEKMIARGERINNEFYVDQVFRNMLERGKNLKVFEVDRYICWGTPAEYELYQKTMAYWTCFLKEERVYEAVCSDSLL